MTQGLRERRCEALDRGRDPSPEKNPEGSTSRAQRMSVPSRRPVSSSTTLQRPTGPADSGARCAATAGPRSRTDLDPVAGTAEGPSAPGEALLATVALEALEGQVQTPGPGEPVGVREQQPGGHNPAVVERPHSAP